MTLNYNLDIGKMVDTLANASSRTLSSITSTFYKLDGLDYQSFKTLYDVIATPVMNYAAATWGHMKNNKCESIQHRDMRTVLEVGRMTPVAAIVT